MDQKRILFILPSLATGGLERMQVTLANRLCRSGYDVTVMILDNNRELENELDSEVSLTRMDYKRKLGRRVPYIRHVFYDDGMWERRATPAALYRYYVGNETYDVEIAFFHGLPVKIISGSTNKDAVHLAWIHTDFTIIKGYRSNFKSDEKVYDAYRKMDTVVCVSESARKGFIKAVGDTGNTKTIYNMLPVSKIMSLAEEEIAYRYPKTGLDLVLVGRLKDSPKGQRRLISAVSRLRKEGYSLSLTLVGDGSDRSAIEAHIIKHRAQEYIFLVGAQQNPFPYIAGADMLVCSSYYEGFNLTVAEALILGTPVISTRCTGPCEILDGGRYGMLVENSESGLYEGLKKLSEDPQLLGTYRSKTKQRSDFFNEDRILNEILQLFEK